jgi:hypothetical protein
MRSIASFCSWNVHRPLRQGGPERPEFVLKHVEATTDGGLGAMQALSRAGNAAEFDDRKEGLNLITFMDSCPGAVKQLD